MSKVKVVTTALLSAGLLTAFGVQASQVTLYGKIDESVLVGKTRHGDTTVQVKSGFTAGSRWGLRGVEDLGGGYKVGFILEQGYNIDDGTEGGTNQAFNRESALYVEGGLGRLTFGRLGTLGFAQSTGILRGAVFGVTYGASGWASGTTSLHFSRVNNAIAYKTPSFGNVTLHAMYSNGTADDDVNKWSKNNHYYGLGALYASKDVSGSIIFEAEDYKNETGIKHNPFYHLTVGGYWQIGQFRPMAIYQYQWGDDRYKQHAAQVGTQIKLAGGTARLGFKYVTRKVDGKGALIQKTEKKGNLWNIGAAYEYPLSKRTKVYGFAGYTDGGKGWSKGSSLTTTNLNGYQVAAGMVHDF